MKPDDYKKFEAEAECSVEILERVVLTMQQFGGDIDMFSDTLLRASTTAPVCLRGGWFDL